MTPDLNAQEIRILKWLSHGNTNDDIAHAFNMSTATVQRAVETAKTKLHAANRVEAVAVAIRLEIIK